MLLRSLIKSAVVILASLKHLIFQKNGSTFLLSSSVRKSIFFMQNSIISLFVSVSSVNWFIARCRIACRSLSIIVGVFSVSIYSVILYILIIIQQHFLFFLVESLQISENELSVPLLLVPSCKWSARNKGVYLINAFISIRELYSELDPVSRLQSENTICQQVPRVHSLHLSLCFFRIVFATNLISYFQIELPLLPRNIITECLFVQC